jgi:hypothetical protein
MSSSLSLTSFLQQNWRRRQNRLCQEARWWGRRSGVGRRDGPNNICTYEQMIKQLKKEKRNIYTSIFITTLFT